MSFVTRSTESALQDGPASHVRYRVLALVGSLSVLTYLDRICISRVQLDIQRDLGLSNAEINVGLSAFMFGYALFEMPVGWLSDIWGTRAVILRIVVWWSFFTALTGAVFNFLPDAPLWFPLPWGWVAVSWGLLSMVVVRFLFGCGEAGVYPTLANVVRTWFPLIERGRAQGVILMSSRIGAAVAPWVIGRLSDAIGWRLAFGALGLLGIVWTVVFAIKYRERPADDPRVNAGELARIGAPSVITHCGAPLPWREILKSPTVWCLAVIHILYVTFGWAFFATSQPRYLFDVYKLSFKDSELMTSLPYVCGAGGTLLGGLLSDRILKWTKNLRWARASVGMGGLACAGTCFLLASLVDDKWQAVALFSLAAFSSDMFLTPAWAAMADIGGRFTGALAGFINMFSLFGAGIFVIAIPQLHKSGYPWPAVLQIIACAWFVAAALWLAVDASRPIVPADATAE